jgi:hypothetical protein
MKKLIAAHFFFLLSWIALVFAVSDGSISRAILVFASYVIGITFRSSAGIGEGLFRKVIGEIPRRERIAMNLRTWGIALIVVGMNFASGTEQVFKSIFVALGNPACAVGFLLVHACYVLKDLRSARSAAEKIAQSGRSGD